MSITVSKTVAEYPDLPYDAIATAILGTRYAVSLVFVGTKRARQLNCTYRQKTYVPDVLSFPLTERVGEIVICPQAANVGARARAVALTDHIAFLFIHGCLHLKGYDHGATMERRERRVCARFGITPNVPEVT